MIVVVGSKNPAKIRPVKKIFEKYFNDVKIVSCEVSSGVSEQPLSEEETYKGALTRAKKAFKLVPEADFSVGIEGGIISHPGGYQEKSTIVVLNKERQVGVGTSGGLFLPEQIIHRIHQGWNLSNAVDELFGVKNAGKKMGAKGLFTNGKVTRAKAYEQAVAFALSRFLHSELF